jgi:hypothetical protein
MQGASMGRSPPGQAHGLAGGARAVTDNGEQGTVGVAGKRKWIRRASHFLTVCGALFIVLLAGLIFFHEAVIDSMYKNVTYITDREMPVTVTPYPSGPDVVSIVGGGGEGLNCSLPPLADLFFDDGDPSTGLRHLVRQKFRQACVFHDLCYRHGLATYGYTQNDCDRILQEQAYRLCEYLPKAVKSSDQCQRDAKKVLAGVSIGGFRSYRAWDRSTFFEFDSHPLRSQRYSVSRVVDHPFKSVDPEKYKDENPQVILTFEIKRSEVRVKCANCGSHRVLNPSPLTANVSKELESVGIKARPEALINRSLELDGVRTVWLPPWRHHAAPHLLTDAAGRQDIVWTSRLESENTMVCVVVADARRLLTYTLPQTPACSAAARSSLGLAEFDIYSSAPQPALIPPGIMVTTGLTGQRGEGLQLCRWPHAGPANQDLPLCTPLATTIGRIVYDLGAFQNFPIVKPDRHVYVSRAISDNSDLQHKVTFWDRIFGNWYSSKGQAMILVDPYGTAASASSPNIQLVVSVPFDISDAYDPMMPLSKSDANNNHLLSVVSQGEQAGLFLIDFAKDWPKPAKLATCMNDAELVLHKSWAQRPTIVVETKKADATKSQLLLSRSLLVPGNVKGREIVLFEIMLLERNLNDSSEKPFDVATSAFCRITYVINTEKENVPCLRTFSPDYLMRSSPGAMLQASQMLVGRFDREGELGLALADACFPSNPIILKPNESGGKTFIATQKRVPATLAHKKTAPRSQRMMECIPLKGPGRLDKQMYASQVAAFAN